MLKTCWSWVLVQRYFWLSFRCPNVGVQKTYEPKLVALGFLEGDSPCSKIDQTKGTLGVSSSLY